MLSEHFGVQWDGPVGWLQQSDGARNVLGIATSSPFEAPEGKCPHRIPLGVERPRADDWAAFQNLLQDPLVQAFLPIPREASERALFVADTTPQLFDWMTTLRRLSSPVVPSLQPLWFWSSQDLKTQLSLTNVMPWVITQVTPRDQRKVDRLLKDVVYSPRTLILIGSPHIVFSSPLKLITTTPVEGAHKLPLEVLGAEVLRRHLRKEDTHGPA
jgi:hypothetical protein